MTDPLMLRANGRRLVALARRDDATAIGLADVGAAIHPRSPQFMELKSQLLESSGDLERARTVATACAAMPAGSDWRAAIAVRLCADRVKRLAGRED